MKTFISGLFLLCAVCVWAQTDTQILATGAGKNFTVDSLSPEGQRFYNERDSLLASYRGELLSEIVNTAVLEAEAKVRMTSTDKLLQPLAARIAAPTPTEIKSVYDANRAQIGGRTLEQARPEIVEHLRSVAKEKAVAAYLQSLRAKHKVLKVKDVGSPGLAPSDILVRIGPRTITVREFREKSSSAVSDREFAIYGNVLTDLETSILSVLIDEEARERGVDAQSVIATELTNRIRPDAPEDRDALISALRKRLFAKHDVKVLLKEPEPFVQAISVDDDPALGPADAPITIVMFSDFECPACAAAHPLLKQVMSEFPGKVRLVVRDYPLTDIHKNAMLAARAAGAAKAQGKFFEYADLLYANQQSLDLASLRKYATGVGLNMKRFELDLNDEKAAAEVRSDIRDGVKYGVSWTPSIYFNGIKIHRSGLDDFRVAIERALAKR